MNFNIDLGKVGLTSAGEWTTLTTYERLTVVTYNGSSYVSRVANKGVVPGTNSSIWQLIAKAGADGSDSGGGTESTGLEILFSSKESASNPSTDPSAYWHQQGVVGDIFMAIRTKTGNTWSSWSVVKVKGEDGADGKDGKDGKDGEGGGEGGDLSVNSSFTSIVFKRSDADTVAAPASSEGDYYNPVPSGWHDGIPEGTGKVWMTTRIFSSDGEWPQESEWKTPAVAVDTGMMDYEWSLLDKPSTPVKATPSSPADAGWYDDINDIPAAGVSSIKWRAERPIENGAYKAGSSWKMIYVKGEKGTAGTSIRVKGTFDDPANLPSNAEEGDAYIYNGTTTTSGGKTWNAGHLYIWDGSDDWIDVGNVQGGYLHVKYSWDGAHFSGPTRGSYGDGETPADYIGILVDGNADDPEIPSDTSSSAYSTLFNKFAWSLCKGADGFGYEYIFKLSATAPATPTPAAGTAVNGKYPADDDFVPEGWYDDPVTPTAAVPNCWVCYRKKIDGVWSAFRGSAENNAVAALFSRYSKDGRSILEVAHYYALSDQPSGVTVVGTTWQKDPESLPVPTEQLPYLWTYDEYVYTEGEPEITVPYLIQKYGKTIVSYTVSYMLVAEDAPAPTASTVGWQSSFPNPTEALPIVYQRVHIEYSEGAPSDFISIVHRLNSIDYLKSVFGELNVDNKNGALLENFIGVKDTSDNKVVAMLNGSSIGEDSTHGKLLIASGMDGITGTGPDQATFKVYEDGHIVAQDGSIGPFTVDGTTLRSEWTNDATYGSSGQFELDAQSLYMNMIGQGGINRGTFCVGYNIGADPTTINYPVCSITSSGENSALRLTGISTGNALDVYGKANFVGKSTFTDLDVMGSAMFSGLVYRMRRPVVNPEANTSITLDPLVHHTVIVRNDNVVVKLPNSSLTGDEYEIITSGKTSAINVDAISSATVIGGGSKTDYSPGAIISLPANYQYTLLYNGAEWVITKH